MLLAGTGLVLVAGGQSRPAAPPPKPALNATVTPAPDGGITYTVARREAPFCATAATQPSPVVPSRTPQSAPAEPPQAAATQPAGGAAGRFAATRPAASRPAKVVPPREVLEERFARLLTNVELRGVWQMTTGDGLEGKAPLGEARPETYTIAKATKLDTDRWQIDARIRFADKDVTLPVIVRVVWAEDTAVITVDDLTIPLIGTYTARVTFYGHFYSGIWRGPDYGGVMMGQIVGTNE